MIEISKEEIRELFRGWGVSQLDDLEKALDRELTDDEYKELVMHILGYADYSKDVKLLDFAEFLNLTDSLTKDEIKILEALKG